jgi:hypothetical protein
MFVMMSKHYKASWISAISAALVEGFGLKVLFVTSI